MGFDRAATQAGLEALVGKAAIENKYRSLIDVRTPYKLTHSIDLDGAYRVDEPQFSRWDYAIGLMFGGTSFAIWVEPHGATSTGEVDSVLRKLKWLEAKLAQPDWSELLSLKNMASDKGIKPFWWLATGRVNFRAGSKEARKLAIAGIGMPVRTIRFGG